MLCLIAAVLLGPTAATQHTEHVNFQGHLRGIEDMPGRLTQLVALQVNLSDAVAAAAAARLSGGKKQSPYSFDGAESMYPPEEDAWRNSNETEELARKVAEQMKQTDDIDISGRYNPTKAPAPVAAPNATVVQPRARLHKPFWRRMWFVWVVGGAVLILCACFGFLLFRGMGFASTVDVEIVSAAGLKRMDPMYFGSSDPYCKVTLQTITGRKKMYTTKTTKTIMNNLNPVWNEKFTFSHYEMGDSILIELYDKDMWPKTDDDLGQVLISAASFEVAGFDNEVQVLNKDGSTGTGKIRVKVSPSKRQAAVDNNQSRRR